MNTTTTVNIPAATPTAPRRRCVLCHRFSADTITSAGFFGTAVDARICRDWRLCDMAEVLT